MRKKGLLIVVALLAIASLMAAMAYTSASLRNTASFKVSNTNAALLAITAGDHAAAGYTSGSTSNELVINWAAGHNGEFGVQSGSVYFWDDLFQITNNSENTVKVTMYVPKDSATPEPNIGSKVYFRAGEGNWVALASRLTPAYNNKIEFTLASGDSIWIDSKIDSMQRTLANGIKGFTIQIDAEAVNDAY